MEEEIKETETQLNEEGSVETPEEETSEKISNEGQESVKEQKGDEVELPQEIKSKVAAFDRIYAERKELKERVKKMEEELQNFKRKEELPPEEKEIEKIVEITSALEGLDAEERKELLLRARAKGVSLAEARKDPNFVLWQQARKAKVEKEALEPTSPRGTTKPKEEILSDEEIKKKWGELVPRAVREGRKKRLEQI